MPRLGDADSAVVRTAFGCEHRQSTHGQPPNHTSSSARVPGSAHVGDAVLAGQAYGEAEDRRYGVQVLMAVEVRHAQPGGQHALDLRAQLALDVDAPPREKELHVATRHRRTRGQGKLLDECEM